ncbi:hypothetical protein TeGR_g10548 [Tetraparma gracilis]|uniref:Centrosomal protein POC5 n=1 Tax=Tetraparma gracilis TaxID=2962635 RepID=A0ABQ6MZV4_9STRA|nr:hypothetical protein TeGR_g10548 [Tetraparma gracilis]
MVDRFVEIKLRILKEHDTVLTDKTTMFTTKVNKLQQTIKELEEELAETQATVQAMAEEKMATCENRAIQHFKQIMVRGAGPSLLTCTKLWRQYTAEKKVERKMERIAGKWSTKNLVQTAMKQWARNVADAKREREDEMSNAKLETVTREIITRYEAELTKHRDGLKEAHQEIARGHVQRQQLEEKMRRTFLKGLTAMNLESIELFSQAANKDASFENDSPNRE